MSEKENKSLDSLIGSLTRLLSDDCQLPDHEKVVLRRAELGSIHRFLHDLGEKVDSLTSPASAQSLSMIG